MSAQASRCPGAAGDMAGAESNGIPTSQPEMTVSGQLDVDDELLVPNSGAPMAIRWSILQSHIIMELIRLKKIFKSSTINPALTSPPLNHVPKRRQQQGRVSRGIWRLSSLWKVPKRLAQPPLNLMAESWQGLNGSLRLMLAAKL